MLAGIRFSGVFASPSVESAYRQQFFGDDRWLGRFLVVAAAVRVALLLMADYQDFGGGSMFWLMFAGRLLFVLVSAGVFVTLGRTASPIASDRLFFGWAVLLLALTASALAARPPDNHVLLLMSFGTVVVAYCLTPLPLGRQAVLALVYSTAVLYVCRKADGVATAAAIHGMSHLLGAISSWRLNRRRREAFFGAQREAELRFGLEAALAEVRTLRGLLAICAWCKRIRDEGETWHAVEQFVQSRTHASFSHGICPDCSQAQAAELA